MFVYELIVKCPHCSTDTRIVSRLGGPVIVHCEGCSKCVVLHDNLVYTVSSGFVQKIMHKYKVKPCGKILGSELSEQARDMITDEKIKDLRKLLAEPMDVKDFIGKIGSSDS